MSSYSMSIGGNTHRCQGAGAISGERKGCSIWYNESMQISSRECMAHLHQHSLLTPSCWLPLDHKAHQSTLIASHFDTYVRRMFINIPLYRYHLLSPCMMV